MNYKKSQPPNHEVGVEEQLVKKSIKGRPKKEESEKKQYDKQYYNHYYHTELQIEVICNKCVRYITKGSLSKHMKSGFCKNSFVCSNHSTC